VTDQSGGELSRRDLRDSARRHSAARRKPSRTRSIVTGLVIAALVGGVAGAAWVLGEPIWDKLTNPSPQAVEDYPGPGEGEASITVEPGDTGTEIADKLVQAGVIATAPPFIKAFTDAGSQAAGIQPGTYALRLKMSASGALTALLDPSSRLAITFTVPEGYRAEDVYRTVGEAMARAELGQGADAAQLEPLAAERAQQVRQVAEDPAAIGLPPEAKGVPEGWLFPNTYAFNIGTEPAEILGAMTAGTVEVLESLDVPRDRWWDVVTLASVVEREVSRAEDRPKAARVFLNRLDKGMKLESDATAAYGAGRVGGGVDMTDAELADPNPFNTYVHQGLPAGPISNPGRAAIEAVVAPAPGAWIYFVTVDLDTGETEFNETWEGHEQSVQKLRAWQAAQQK
jgi:UPF0755 protein